jgi:tetratricopeptide (TPR) repeat protein
MKTKTAFVVTSLLGLSVVASGGQKESAANILRLVYPGKPWAFTINLPGFTVKANRIEPERRVYLLADKPNTGYTASVMLEKVNQPIEPNGCRDFLAARAKANSGFEKKDIRLSESGQMAILEYLVPDLKGHKIRQKNLFACMAREDVYIDIHLSKTLYQPGEEKLFEGILQTVGFEQITLSPRMQEMRNASSAYMRQDYPKAIVEYEKVLAQEREDPQLEKSLWRVLIDNLGMAYGVTGDLKRAQETFEYGLTKDPTYPLFHYCMACTYAERGEFEKTVEYLKKAFEYKENIIPGEKMPDPRKDPSFSKFMKRGDFRKLIDSLTPPSN